MVPIYAERIALNERVNGMGLFFFSLKKCQDKVYENGLKTYTW